MTEQQKVLQIEIHKIIDDLQNGLVHPLTAKNRLYESANKALTIPVVSNNEVALKTFVEEFVEAWEDGDGGDSDLYREAKSLL